MKKFIYSIFFINLLIILFFWWNGSASLLSGRLPDIILAFGRLCGLLAVYFVLLQFVMRGRAVWIEHTFGLNNLATAHRLNGYLSISFITLHVLSILTSNSMISGNNIFIQAFIFVTTYFDLLKAFLAFLLFITIVFFSIYIVRKRLKYETWYYIHLLTYLAILLAWGHQLNFGGDFASSQVFVWYWYTLYIFVFGNLLVFRFLRQGYLFVKYRFRVAEIVKEADNSASVYITGNNLSAFKSQPGQFFILRFLDTKRWMEAHPFSLSFVPKNNLFRLTIKNVGDFTSEITKLKKGTPILLDGPLGTFTSKSATKDKYLFIAGGVGITPIRSLIEELAVLKKDFILLYSNKTTDIIFKKELDGLVRQYNFPIHYIISEDKSYKGEKGRIDAEKIKRLAPDFLKRDIYLCGPVPMMDSLIKTLQDLGVSHSSIHYERFSL
jgi:predicted ferric reductase